MRRRDKIFVAVAWAGLLGGLAWALLTQFRWVQEAKPIQLPKPGKGAEGKEGKNGKEDEEGGPPASATGVVGTVSDDTRASMAKGLGRKPVKPAPGSTPGLAPGPTSRPQP